MQPSPSSALRLALCQPLRQFAAAATLTLAGVGAAAAAGAPVAAAEAAAVPVPAALQQAARQIATELAEHCPLAPAGDTAAYNRCRQHLFNGSALRAQLSPFIIWGRQSKVAGATLRQTNLTQFAPDVWTSMYAPLFMFNGRHTVAWVPEERLFLVRLEAAFRNRLAPGQFPYPFWHEAEKWGMYESANGLMLWIAPDTLKVRAAQFTDRAPNAMLHAVVPANPAPHDNKTWLWTDDKGVTQPAVSLFDGLYRADNPHIKAMDRQYRDLALQMRESQCTACHVPSNPDKMSRLVLLSTPVHAAGEIDRLIKSVKEDRMPMDEYRLSYSLPDEAKRLLLDSAEAFRTTVQAAQAWERQQATRLQATPQPATNVSANRNPQVTK